MGRLLRLRRRSVACITSVSMLPLYHFRSSFEEIPVTPCRIPCSIASVLFYHVFEIDDDFDTLVRLPLLHVVPWMRVIYTPYPFGGCCSGQRIRFFWSVVHAGMPQKGRRDANGSEKPAKQLRERLSFVELRDSIAPSDNLKDMLIGAYANGKRRLIFLPTLSARPFFTGLPPGAGSGNVEPADDRKGQKKLWPRQPPPSALPDLRPPARTHERTSKAHLPWRGMEGYGSSSERLSSRIHGYLIQRCIGDKTVVLFEALHDGMRRRPRSGRSGFSGSFGICRLLSFTSAYYHHLPVDSA